MFETDLLKMTTIIYTNLKVEEESYQFQSSGFFYTESVPTDPNRKGSQWHKLERYWLVSNRHVFFPEIENATYIPDEITFHFRSLKENRMQWVPVILEKDFIVRNLKLHRNSNVDISMIDISEIISEYIEKFRESNYMEIIVPTALTNHNLPSNQSIAIEVTSDVVIASYPDGFYDEYNTFPIVKSGIVASGWNLWFKGRPMFQVDAQLFPGSSGGLVITKPISISMETGQDSYGETKQFAFLGVYSGEYLKKETIEINGETTIVEKSYGLGNVWYSFLIPEIISKGITVEQP